MRLNGLGGRGGSEGWRGEGACLPTVFFSSFRRKWGDKVERRERLTVNYMGARLRAWAATDLNSKRLRRLPSFFGAPLT